MLPVSSTVKGLNCLGCIDYMFCLNTPVSTRRLGDVQATLLMSCQHFVLTGTVHKVLQTDIICQLCHPVFTCEVNMTETGEMTWVSSHDSMWNVAAIN